MDIDDAAPEIDKSCVKRNTKKPVSEHDTLEKDTKIKRSCVKPDKVEKEVSNTSKDLNSTYDKIETPEKKKEPKSKRSLQNISQTESQKKTPNIESAEKLSNKNKETETKIRKSSLLNNSSMKKTNDASIVINTTFEKTSDDKQKPTTLDSTFDKSDPKLNVTFEKTVSQKSSIISSDSSPVNVTFDKDNSKISITSDESKTENIVNTTPVLIESSLDESHLLVLKTSDKESSRLSEDISTSTKDTLQPTTPLKREGTFTKETTEMTFINNTPTKRMTLPSPGLTPYHVTKSSQKEKSMLNVTRSIEKSNDTSSLAEVAPRQTRVMFCSPMNNPAVVSQQKKKVIKSSMKGSNKSFVFDESASVVRPAARKRSLTQGDAEDTLAKRKRLADDIQLSVNRLSRPRTSSVTVKLPETTPSKKPLTPSKSKSDTKRTKLPNFAALHQKQFDKMESLGECQERKLRRARKLLLPKTPNGTVTVLERSSPREQTRPIEPKSTTKKPETTTKKTEVLPKKTETVPNKIDSPKKTDLPTLESLRPGFTRFGFKINTEFNPFSIPRKNETKNTLKEKPNGLTAKTSFAPKTPVVPTVKPVPATVLPSVKGGTTRKEAAKQIVMREKSFTSLSSKRDVKRNENRTIIKGVRTNRRFELQMRMRNID